MSDKTDKPGQPKQDAGKTAGDKHDEPKPIEKVSVDVNVMPRDRRKPVDNKVAQKVREGVRQKVREAIEEKKGEGWQKQLDAAEKAAQGEGEKIPGNHVKEVKVKVDGERKDEKGRRRSVYKEIDVKPGD